MSKSKKKVSKKASKPTVVKRGSLVSPEETGALDRYGIETSSRPDPDGFAYSLQAGGFRVDFDSETAVVRLARALGKHIGNVVDLAVRDALRASKSPPARKIPIKKSPAKLVPVPPAKPAAEATPVQAS